MLDDEAKARADMLVVPREFGKSAEAAFLTGTPLFDSDNRRAAAWGRRASAALQLKAKKKRRNRNATKAAMVARRSARR